MEQDFPLFPPSASSVAERVDFLYGSLVAIATFFVLLISLLVLVFAVKYRRSRHGAVAVHIPGSWALEITWTAIPLCIVMTIFTVGARIFLDQSRPPAGAMEISVVGKQWMWKLQHPDGVREINDLHVARGQPVKLTMTSQDVIHSFFIPAFRLKRDVLPGRYTELWFEATKTGRYHIFCAEYCGTKHSRMIGTLHVLEPADYEAWLASAARGQSPREAGERLFEALACGGCHSPASGERGPDLAGLFGRRVRLEGGASALADEGYLREAILDPNASLVAGYRSLMPSYRGQLTEEQLLQLIQYIKGLAPGGGPRR